MKLTGSPTNQNYILDLTAPFLKMHSNNDLLNVSPFFLNSLFLFYLSLRCPLSLNSTYPSKLNLNPTSSVTSSPTSHHQCYHVSPSLNSKAHYYPSSFTLVVTFSNKTVRCLRAGTTYSSVSPPGHSAERTLMSAGSIQLHLIVLGLNLQIRHDR